MSLMLLSWHRISWFLPMQVLCLSLHRGSTKTAVTFIPLGFEANWTTKQYTALRRVACLDRLQYNKFVPLADPIIGADK